ncbi:MAG: DUF2147 domain-containing protein [Acinetobacter sp.]
MQKIAILGVFTASLFTCCMTFAQDLSGLWQQIDDKTGSPKALIEMKTQADGSYTGIISKVTPRPGYTPREKCIKCPPPYTDKPILGLEVIKGLKFINNNNYAHGRVLDPLTGKIYDLKGRISANGKRLTLRGYVGISAIGRTQTWIRQD